VQITAETQQDFAHNIFIACSRTSIKAQPVALAQLGERQTEVISHYIWRYSVRSAEATQLLLRLSNIRIMNILFCSSGTPAHARNHCMMLFMHSIGPMHSPFAALSVLESLLSGAGVSDL
jgi:hypothetical protein